LCFEQTSPLRRCKLRFTRFLNKKAHHASLQLLFIKSPKGLLMRRKNNGAKRGFLQKESDYSEICSDDVRLRVPKYQVIAWYLAQFAQSALFSVHPKGAVAK